jgi:hypothetical protein
MAEFLNLDIFAKRAENLAFQWVQKCYMLPIPRTYSNEIVQCSKSFLISDLTSDMISTVKSLEAELNHPLLKNLLQKMEIFCCSLLPFDSCTKVQSYLSSEFVPPTPMHYTSSLAISKNISQGYFIQLGNVFKTYFELPGVLSLALEFQSFCEKSKSSGTVFHFLQSRTWSEIKKKSSDSISEGTILMPLFMYFDDYEGKNPLGSHKGVHKLVGCYLSIPTFPAEMESSLQNIFLGSLFHSSLKVKIGTSQTFSSLVEVLNILQSNGISVSVQGKHFKLKF